MITQPLTQRVARITGERRGFLLAGMHLTLK